MERPGLLEFAVYALVLTVVAGWVYAVPPFDHQPGSRVQSAQVQPTSAVSSAALSDQSAAAGEVGSQEGAAEASEAQSAAAQSAAAQSAAASDPDAQPRLDPQPNLLVVTARSLNMRSEPNAGSALVGSYPRGALVEQVETSGNWVLVRTEDEATGWMYIGYLGVAGAN